ncbi:MAG: RluA family pseudouridine synthase [Polaromonas sp.]|nr:RluA family pseudouridine synthase [Polaromonas sp.]
MQTRLEEEVLEDILEPDDASCQPELRRALVGVTGHGLRLDRMLVNLVPEFSRSYLQRLMSVGAVKVNGEMSSKPSLRIRAGDAIEIELRPTPESQAFVAQQMPLDIVFEDAHLVVLNKPAGLVVHPAPGNWSGTLLNGLLHRYQDAASLPRAGIVHRLDKDTSGLMVVARHRSAMDRLVKMIAAREVSREYLALAHGNWQGSRSIEINHSVGRDPRNRLRMAVVDLERNPGKFASTAVSLLENSESNGKFCLLKCKLRTGRTHQIRVHLAFIGHAIAADSLYGGVHAGGLQRQALHAFRLAFAHPASGEPLTFASALPVDFAEALGLLGVRYDILP